MEFVEPCFMKLNLILRIGARGSDGLHSLESLFLRIPSHETLTITGFNGKNVRDQFRTLKIPIFGENIVERTARALREIGIPLPPLEVEISKQVPPGSGLGAGSGNAAAFLRWASRLYGAVLDYNWISRRLGSDIPFLAGSDMCSLVGGKGEKLSPLPHEGGLGIKTLVAVPKWSIDTAGAYRTLDRMREEGLLPFGSFKGEKGSLEEATGLLSDLSHGKEVGLLQNDFLPVLCSARPQYQEAFEEAKRKRALGWGISGSGSSFFILMPSEGDGLRDLCLKMMDWDWICKLWVLG